MKYSKKLINEAISYWKKQLRSLNENTQEELEKETCKLLYKYYKITADPIFKKENPITNLVSLYSLLQQLDKFICLDNEKSNNYAKEQGKKVAELASNFVYEFGNLIFSCVPNEIIRSVDSELREIK